MIQAIGLIKVSKYFASIAIVIFVFLLVLTEVTLELQWESAKEILRIISLSTLITGTLFTVVGNKKFFPLICRHVGGNNFPDISGKWRGQILSNRPAIEALQAGDALKGVDKLPVDVTVEFQVSLLKIVMTLDAHIGESKTLSVTPIYDSDADRFELVYVYLVESKNGAGNDDQVYYGAAKLRLKTDGEGKALLQGVYWTNRNWPVGENTAGEVRLTRSTKKNKR